MILVYYSLGGNVERFCQNTGLISIEITETNPFFEIPVDYVLVVPTYDAIATEPIWDFLNTGNNAKNCVGIAGSGNINFDDLYIFTAKDLSKEFNIPIIYDFEYFGTKRDVENFKKEVEKLEVSKTN